MVGSLYQVGLYWASAWSAAGEVGRMAGQAGRLSWSDGGLSCLAENRTSSVYFKVLISFQTVAKTVLLGPVVSSCKQGFGEPQADKQACLRDSINILKKARCAYGWLFFNWWMEWNKIVTCYIFEIVNICNNHVYNNIVYNMHPFDVPCITADNL